MLDMNNAVDGRMNYLELRGSSRNDAMDKNDRGRVEVRTAVRSIWKEVERTIGAD